MVKIDEKLSAEVEGLSRERDLALEALTSGKESCEERLQEAERLAERVLADAITALEYVGISGALPKRVRPTQFESQDLAHRSVNEFEDMMLKQLDELNLLLRQLHETRPAESGEAGTNRVREPGSVSLGTGGRFGWSWLRNERTGRPQWSVACILALVIVIAVLLAVL